MSSTSTLKSISEFIRTGKTPPTQEVKYFNGKVQWFTPGDLDKEKYLGISNRSLTELAFIDKKATYFPAGTLLVACIGDIGKLGITTQDCSANQQITGIKPNSTTDVNFLYYWFRHNKMVIQHFANNAVVPIINNGTLEKIKIPLPPLPEQQKIASILDAADNLRQKDQQLIEKYSVLSQSLFLEMFGDPVANPHNFPISKLSTAYINIKEGTKCGPFGSALKKFEYIDQGVPVWIMDNIQNSSFVYDKCLFITEEKYLSLQIYSTLSGDIIISRAGTVGKMCVVPDSYKKAIISTNLIRLRLDKNIVLPIFFVLLMKYFASKVGRIKTGSDGSFTHMNTGVLNDLEFPFPPISLQNQFAERIQDIEAQKQLAVASLDKSEALFNSLLQRAFKGELTT